MDSRHISSDLGTKKMPQSYVLFDSGPTGEPAVFTDPAYMIYAHRPEEVPAAFRAMEQAQDQGCWLAGYVSYELGYVLEPKLQPHII